jgi:uncharacterized membrane protein YvbJ
VQAPNVSLFLVLYYVLISIQSILWLDEKKFQNKRKLTKKLAKTKSFSFREHVKTSIPMLICILVCIHIFESNLKTYL